MVDEHIHKNKILRTQKQKYHNLIKFMRVSDGATYLYLFPTFWVRKVSNWVKT